MGVAITPSTLSEGWTPICNNCGIAESYDISNAEYYSNMAFWDNWTCPDCKDSEKEGKKTKDFLIGRKKEKTSQEKLGVTDEEEWFNISDMPGM